MQTFFFPILLSKITAFISFITINWLVKWLFSRRILYHFVGGLDSKTQEAALRKGPDIVIATPGRLVDHLHNTPSFSLQTVEIIVLDEADRCSKTL